MERRRAAFGILVGAVVIAASVWAVPTSTAAGTSSAWTDATRPANSASNDSRKVELGMRFKPVTDGTIRGARFHKDVRNTGTHTATLWTDDGKALTTATFANETASGWQNVQFSKPVTVKAGQSYVISYLAPNGHYSYDYRYFQKTVTRGSIKTSANAGLYRYGGGFPKNTFRASNYWVDVIFAAATSTTSVPTSAPASTTSTTAKPTTTSTQKPATTTSTTARPATTTSTTEAPVTPEREGWPSAANTGPNTTMLLPYTGSCDIRESNVVIDSKKVNCSLLLYGSNITIKNSLVQGTIMTNSATASVTVQDSIVNGGSAYRGTLQGERITVLRSEISGGEHGILCGGDCVIRDSFIHSLYDGRSQDWHQNGILSNGGSNFVIEHNTVECNGACTANIAFINDGDLSNATVTNNLLVATTDVGFCAYPMGGTPSKPGKSSNMVWTGNVFERGANGKCGSYGPVYEIVAGGGNVFSGNKWDDGTPLNG
jgi:hypothetical protein